MALDPAIRQGRRLARKRMTDRCTITRPTGKMTAGTGSAPDTPEVQQIVTNYPVRLRPYEAYEVTTEVAGATITHQRTPARLPNDTAYLPRVGDILTITSSRNPALVTTPPRQFRIATIPQDSDPTQFRPHLDEVTSP